MNERSIIQAARKHLSNGDREACISSASEIARSQEASPDGLCAVAEVFLAADGSPGDAEGQYRRALEIEPTHMLASTGLVDILLRSNRYTASAEEVDRFLALNDSNLYRGQIVAIATSLKLPAAEDQDGVGLESKESRGGKSRYNHNRNPLDHLRGLEKQQDRFRSQGQGEKINSKGKSEQDLENEFRRIRTRADVDGSPINNTRVGEE